LVGLLLTLVVGGSVPMDQPTDYGVRDATGKWVLKHPLILREEQFGTGGSSGTVWAIKSDGRWSVFQFWSARGKERELADSRVEGVLTQEQLSHLVSMLSAQNLKALPLQVEAGPELGKGSNAHRYVLVFGDHKVTLKGVPSRRDDTPLENIQRSIEQAEKARSKQVSRFSNIARQMITLTRGS
jgi:hypothetical protein